ncbi:PilN domain-containing protein [Thiocystis violacea]|uniref:PilN domain-containing protein n=1 Tax=Thiocystis violacea TaxID=13725 RepID=UPI00190605FB|nr:PilN domain-containing protein [Thiocystis violacea]MBK1717424.1 fimbrial assembly protein [Thiocystis violacea]
MTLTERLTLLAKGLPISGPGARLFPEDLQERFLTCLPDFARGVLARHNRRLIIEAEGELGRLSLITGLETHPLGEMDLTQTASLPEALAQRDQDRAHKTELRLPRGAVLTRSVSFPARVRSNLPQVIRYELDRLSPFQAKDVVFDFMTHGGAKSADRLSLDLALCRRDLVEGWIKRLAELGSPIDRISWEGAWSGANLLPLEQRPHRRRVRFNLGTASIAASVLLALAIGLTPLWQKNHLAQKLEAELSRVRAQAVAVDELRQELERVRQGSTLVLQRKLDQPPILEMLRDLTDRLPEDTWVQNLEFNEGQVDIRGESGQATALIGTLEQAPGIDGVSFGSPVTQIARTGKERFNIAFRYTGSESGSESE